MRSTGSTPLQDDRFLLLETLGRGGMGSVYRAFDRAEQRLVALKVPSASDRPGPGHPLCAEFDVSSRLRHPNIVRALELRYARSGPIAADTPYLVLEHVDGRPTHRAMRPGRVADADATRLGAQLLAALDHVHAAGYVHRDMKPGNVLAHRVAQTRLGFKLTDFGLAAHAGESSPLGTFSGCLPYVAPEGLLGLPLDGRADLYGLGILLYHLTTGELPAPNGGARDILRWHLTGPPADPARVRPDISPRLSRFVRRLTQHDRDERPASAARALRLLGLRGPAGRERPGVPSEARGELACLRLSLDAARLGARRVFRMPRRPEVVASLRRELTVWCQVRGLACHELTEPPERLVLGLLADRGRDAADLVRRYALGRWLRLELLGDVPLLDPEARTRRSGPARRDAIAGAARSVARLIADCSARRTLVLWCGRRQSRSPLARLLLHELSGSGAPSAVRSPRGGLLLVVER